MGDYSVATTNRFALSVDEDEDLYELLEKQQEEKKRKQEEAAAEAARIAANKAKGVKGNKSAKGRPVKSADNKNVSGQQQKNAPNSKPYPRNDGKLCSLVLKNSTFFKFCLQKFKY